MGGPPLPRTRALLLRIQLSAILVLAQLNFWEGLTYKAPDKKHRNLGEEAGEHFRGKRKMQTKTPGWETSRETETTKPIDSEWCRETSVWIKSLTGGRFIWNEGKFSEPWVWSDFCGSRLSTYRITSTSKLPSTGNTRYVKKLQVEFIARVWKFTVARPTCLLVIRKQEVGKKRFQYFQENDFC